MASPSVTYTFSNSTTADAGQVNQNFTDLINGLSDGTKDLSISALTCAGNAALNGNTTIGNASGDDLTITASLASTIPIKTTNTYNFGSATKGLQYIYFGSSAGANTTRVVGSAVSADVQLILPDVSGTLRLVGDTQAKTGTYTALTTDGIIKVDTTSAFTVTLYTAVGNTGKELTFVKTTNDVNALTIDGNGSETINGALTTTIDSQYEVLKIRSDGSNWYIVERRIPSEWVAWTPTSSWVSNVTHTGMKRRVGDTAFYRVKLAITGTPTNTTLTINMPSGEVIDTAKFASTPTADVTPFGFGHERDTSLTLNAQLAVVYSTTTAVKCLAARTFDGSVFVSNNQVLSNTAPHSPGLASGDLIEVEWSVPIVGWKG
jgi:hypothetical protein